MKTRKRKLVTYCAVCNSRLIIRCIPGETFDTREIAEIEQDFTCWKCEGESNVDSK